MPGRQPANDEKIDKEIEIAGHGFPIDCQAPREIGGIEDLRLGVRERLDGRGNVLVPLDENAVRALA